MRGWWAGVGLWSALLFIPVMGSSQELPRTATAYEETDVTSGRSPVRLTRSGTTFDKVASRTDEKPRNGQSGWGSMAGSLVIVLALIVGCGYLLKRQGGRGSGVLREELVQLLGRKALDSRTTLQLVRCGSKILVLSNSVQHGVRTLSEITDPHEVESILAQCLTTRESNGVAQVTSGLTGAGIGPDLDSAETRRSSSRVPSKAITNSARVTAQSGGPHA